MDDRSGDASALLGMEGFVVLSQTEEDGECWVLVETTADAAGCPSCGVRATGHGRSEVEVRDLPMGGRPVRLVWRKRRWICLDPDCPAKSFTEEAPAIEGSLTRRAAKEICRRVGQDAHSVAQVARDFGIGWATAMGCVRRHGEPLVDDPGRIGVTRALGVDEHKVLSATKHWRTRLAWRAFNLAAWSLKERTRGAQSSSGIVPRSKLESWLQTSVSKDTPVENSRKRSATTIHAGGWVATARTPAETGSSSAGGRALVST